MSTDKLLSQSDIQFKPLLQLATKAALAGGLLCAVVADSLFMLMQLAIKAALSGIPYVLELQIAFIMLLQLTIIKAALAEGSL